jgi:large subunit ribosomal protein L17
MQHAKKNRTLNRSKSQRTALLRGLAISLFEEGKIRTTSAKAKELKPYAEKIITTAKKDSVISRRSVASKLGEPTDKTIKNIFEKVAPNYTDRSGGYTRIIKMGRTSAGRDEAVIELV